MLPPENTTKALELINLISGYYKNLRDQFSEDDDYYNGDLGNKVEVPEGFEVSIPTTARAIIDEAVDNIEPFHHHVQSIGCVSSPALDTLAGIVVPLGIQSIPIGFVDSFHTLMHWSLSL